MALRPDISIIYSVVIPAFNEEAFLPRTLQCLKNSMDKIDPMCALLNSMVLMLNDDEDDQDAINDFLNDPIKI